MSREKARTIAKVNFLVALIGILWLMTALAILIFSQPTSKIVDRALIQENSRALI